MPSHQSVLRVVSTLALFAALTTGCTSGGIDGKYYNSTSGEFAMELKGGQVLMQGQEGHPLTYEIKGDSLVIHDPQGGMVDRMTFGIEKDGTLSLGILGSLTKKRK